MKRKLALLLALVMVISMLPMTAFAASDNRVSRVPNVKNDVTFGVDVDAPVLRIEEKGNDFGTRTQTFRLALENAEWKYTNASDVVSVVYGTNGTITPIVNKITDTILEISFAAPTDEKVIIDVTLLSEVQASGEVVVVVEPRDSDITGGRYVFANAAGGSTVATIDAVRSFGAGMVELADIKVDETRIGSLGNGKSINLRLPNNFAWDANGTDGAISFAGGYRGKVTSVEINGQTLTVSNNRVLLDALSSSSIGGRDLNITLNLSSAATSRGTVILEKVGVRASTNARFGDVVVLVRGDASDEDLLVAKYSDYEFTVEAAGNPRELVAGRFASTIRVQDIVLEETVADSWLAGRTTRVEFPAGVKVLSASVRANDSTNIKSGYTIPVSSENSYFEFTDPKANDGNRTKMVIRTFVSVKADYVGEITAQVTGRGLPNDVDAVVLADVVPPVEVEAEVAQLRIGVRNQALGNITITETADERIKAGSGKDLVLTLEEGLGVWNSVPTIEVVEGDLELDVKNATINATNRTLTIPVKSESRVASTIVISDATINLNRVPAEGIFNLTVGGSAIVENDVTDYSGSTADALENGYFRQSFVAEVGIAEVVTPAPGQEEARPEVKFTIGSTNFMVGNELEPMGVAPYIKDNRTFVPVTFVARALGMDRSAVVWNHDNRTVTIFAERVVQMEIGSNVMMINGVSVQMDTAPEITMDRTFVPIAHAARALGVDYSWDQATQTVSFN